MTTINTARRAFFRGKAVRIEHHVPWAVDDFERYCQRCDACVQACEEAILVPADGGFPSVDFRRGACTFCGRCVTSCQHGALDKAVVKPWQLVAAVGDTCISLHGVTCRSCAESCDRQAIAFRLQLAGRATPLVDAASCTGCGACVGVCPVAAITIGESQ